MYEELLRTLEQRITKKESQIASIKSESLREIGMIRDEISELREKITEEKRRQEAPPEPPHNYVRITVRPGSNVTRVVLAHRTAVDRWYCTDQIGWHSWEGLLSKLFTVGRIESIRALSARDTLWSRTPSEELESF